MRVIECGDERGAPVLLIHGWGSSVYSFAGTLPALANAGFRAVAFDLPGHGLSDRPTDASVYTAASLAGLVLAVATACGLDRFALIGHSMGGAIGLQLAARHEPRVERLVLINPVGLGTTPIIGPLKLISPRFVMPFVPRLLGRHVVAAVLRLAFATKGRPTARDIDEYWAPTRFKEYAWACRALVHEFEFDRLSSEALRSIRVSVLVITGGRDRLVMGGLRRASLIPSARRVHIEEGGHLVMQECAEKTNAAIVAFLREPPSP